ncbi:DUF1579 family protein [Vulgatibacter sp.]|uniref:DUF1579 family protein n=1 Tax=Vulgatibacter sp. TaxID=1971226 RepID=UPI003564B6A2
MSERIDATQSETAPFQPSAAHEALAAMVGQWRGPTKTWLDPSAPPDESITEATVEPLLGCRWIRIDYRGRVLGKLHAGQMIVGFHKDAQEHEIAWLDSFHTGTAMMFSIGKASGDGSVSVLGSYAAGPERWGWRTGLRMDDGRLVLEAWNITPDGQEFPAIETRLARR